jgi:hypothetical protein
MDSQGILAKPDFSPSVFWDCRAEKINYDESKSFVIERVLTRGTEQDERELFRYYGGETIKNTVLNLRYLDRKTLNYLSIVFNIPQEKFRCYRKTSSKDPFGMFS